MVSKVLRILAETSLPLSVVSGNIEFVEQFLAIVDGRGRLLGARVNFAR